MHLQPLSRVAQEHAAGPHVHLSRLLVRALPILSARMSAYKGNHQGTRSQWAQSMTAEQSAAVHSVLALLRSVEGYYRGSVSVYYFPTTGVPAYIEVRLRNEHRALVKSYVVWSESRRPIDLLGVIPHGYGFPDLAQVAE